MWIQWIGKFHLPIVDFPIALFFAAGIAELCRMATGKQMYGHASRFCVWFATCGALLAVLLGWFSAGLHWSDDEALLTPHRWLGSATALWALGVLVASERSQRAADGNGLTLFRIMLFICVILVAITGYLGGALFLGPGYYLFSGCQ